MISNTTYLSTIFLRILGMFIVRQSSCIGKTAIVCSRSRMWMAGTDPKNAGYTNSNLRSQSWSLSADAIHVSSLFMPLSSARLYYFILFFPGSGSSKTLAVDKRLYLIFRLCLLVFIRLRQNLDTPNGKNSFTEDLP